MNILAIDTSTELATVAVAVNEEILSEEQGSMRQHAQFLLPMIKRLLATSGLTFNQLDGIVFGRGPGSFTGLRIACSVAKGLAYASDLPLYPVSCLAAIADEVYQTAAADAKVLAMVDARMHQVYWGCFTGTTFEVQEQVSSAADISLESVSSLILAGVGYEAYEQQFSTELREQIVKRYSVFPKATAMVRLVQKGHIKAVSAAEALPIYVRNQVTHGTEKGASGG